MDRPALERAVVAAVAGLPLRLRLYGSFGNRTFHLDEATAGSFSDLDLLAEGAAEGQIAALEPVLRRRVAAATGIRLRVSLRSRRLHARHLDAEQSYLVAVIEEGCKLGRAGGDGEIFYHAFKFLWRTACWPVCYDAPLRLADYLGLGVGEPLAQALIDVKLGTVRPSRELLAEAVARLRKAAPRTAGDVLLLLDADGRRRLLNDAAQAAPRVLAGQGELLAECRHKLQAGGQEASHSGRAPRSGPWVQHGA